MAQDTKRYKQMAVRDLVPYKNNARTHSEDQVDKIARSIAEFGFINPVLIDKENTIIAGHGRVAAAKKMGLHEVPTLLVDDLTPEQIRAYVIADNKLAEDAGWDMEVLKIELAELAELDFDITLTGFDFSDIETEEEQEAVEDDFVDDLTEEPNAKQGEIYQLGNHFLMCGDSTKEEDIKALIGDSKIDLFLSDPPYGVNIVSTNNKVGGGGTTKFGKVGGGLYVDSKTYLQVKGDESTDTARANYEIIKNYSDNQIIFGGNYFTDFLPPRACWLVWDKEINGNFADFEMAWTSYGKAAKIYRWLWNGMSRKGARSVEGTTRVHPTQKPVGMLGEILKDFTEEGAKVLDCFGGSGSTLIACEQLGRTCFMLEYEPHYIDVIIARWEKFTGKKAVLISGNS